MQVLVEFAGVLVMVAPDGGLLNGAVHAFDLAVGPGMGWLGQAVFHAVFPADSVKTLPAGQKLVGLRFKRSAAAG